MIIFLYGQDTFRSRQHLKKMVAKFKAERDPDGYNTVMLDGERGDKSELLNALLAVPFLATRRMVVLENILSRRDDGLVKELAERIAQGRLPDTNVIIVWQGADIGKNKAAKELYALLQKEKFAQEFAPLTGAALREWVQREVGELKGSVNSAALNDIVALVAQMDLWYVRSLLHQLCAYANGKEIQRADVVLFLEEKAANNIFGLAEAIAEGDSRSAFRLLEAARREDEDDFYIMSMIVRQFRILIQMRSVFESGDNIPSDVMAKMLGIHPFVAKKTLPLVRRYRLNDLRTVYDRLLLLDLGSKTGVAGIETLTDVFVAQVCRDKTK